MQAGHVPCLPMGLPLLGNLCPQTQRTWPLGTAWRLPPKRAMFPAEPGNSPGPLAALSAWLQRGGQKVTGHCFIAPAAFPRPSPAGLGPCLAARASVQHGDMGARSVSGRPRWLAGLTSCPPVPGPQDPVPCRSQGWVSTQNRAKWCPPALCCPWSDPTVVPSGFKTLVGLRHHQGVSTSD